MVVESLLDWTRLKESAEKFGPRFHLLANSTSPVYDSRVGEACKMLEMNGSRVIVARKEFAHELKDHHPLLKLNASCIMSLYEDFNQLMTSDLFEEVCAPQTWNYNLEEMIKNVPLEQRHRVYYIVNSQCKWNREPCKKHYELLSESYRAEELPHSGVNHSSESVENDPEKFLKRSKDVYEGLLKGGFKIIKLQGRSERPRITRIFLDYMRGVGELESYSYLSQDPSLKESRR